MTTMSDQVSNAARAVTEPKREGPMTRAMEQQASATPTDVFLAAAGLSILGSLGLYALGKRHSALFVAHWVPTILTLGLYNKLARIVGPEDGQQGHGDEPESP